MPSYEGDTNVISSSHHNNNHSIISLHHKKSLNSRAVSKEASKPNSSCRVYYCEAAGAVPFVWESQPGTPKHPLFEPSSGLVPPLTPPPSYSSSSSSSAAAGKRRDRPRLDHLVGSILPRRSRGSSSFSLSSSASLSSLSSSWSYSAGSKAAAAAEFSDGDSGEIPVASSLSPTSTLSFPAAVKKTAWRFVSGCYANVKKVNY